MLPNSRSHGRQRTQTEQDVAGSTQSVAGAECVEHRFELYGGLRSVAAWSYDIDLSFLDPRHRSGHPYERAVGVTT